MFDVGEYAFGSETIKRHMHTLEGRVPETVEGQHRLMQKWLCNREKLYKNQKRDPSDISDWQLERASFLVDYAFSTNPFYHKLYSSVGYKRGGIVTWEDYNALPTISKKDIIENYDCFTRNLGPSLTECGSPRTSGSSGRTLQVLRDPSMTDFHALQEMRFFEQILGRQREPSDWLYLIYVDCPPYTSLDGAFPTFSVSNDCPPPAVLNHWKQLKPAIVSGFPSYLSRLASLVDAPADLGIEAITTNSETSTKAERQKISEKLGAPVYDEYSSIELGYIATECPEGHYHVAEDNVRVDVLNPDDNGVGEIVATNLVNTYFPTIRYRQGDVIQVGKSDDLCECGNNFRQLKSFLGRADQLLYSQTKGKVPPDRVMALYDRILIPSEAEVDEFKIVQTKKDEVKLFLVPAVGSVHPNMEAVKSFVSGLHDLFQDPNLKIKIEQVQAMPPNKSYKRRLIVNEL